MFSYSHRITLAEIPGGIIINIVETSVSPLPPGGTNLPLHLGCPSSLSSGLVVVFSNVSFSQAAADG